MATNLLNWRVVGHDLSLKYDSPTFMTNLWWPSKPRLVRQETQLEHGSCTTRNTWKYCKERCEKKESATVTMPKENHELTMDVTRKPRQSSRTYFERLAASPQTTNGLLIEQVLILEMLRFNETWSNKIFDQQIRNRSKFHLKTVQGPYYTSSLQLIYHSNTLK